ncbi:ANK2 [Symbiodinium pilosum]|uniref:ANK2 protein n=1 Tax=Symbiodinium pilosum TaxID=2952 RepID=A0A812P4W5_SYMPI|nr:ANK2 [Symbiodinium pilosum]
MTEGSVPNAKPLPMKEFQAKPLFLWYDYFSVPQLEERKSYTTDERDGSQQARAINSIPSYVARCRFFLALCPVLDCPSEAKVLSAATWSRRGWCRVERAARELSRDSSWILIQSETSMEVVGTAISFGSGCVGEGEFTVPEDRQKLAPVMRSIVQQKLRHCLQSGDLPAFRSLEIDPIVLLPDSRTDSTTNFLLQNGLKQRSRADRAGWSPVHYAALAGDTEVLRNLLDKKAKVNVRTPKDEPALGFPPWMSALDLALFFKHHEAVRLLLAAKAHVQGGFLTAMNWAAQSDNVEGVRMVCAAGGSPLAPNLIGTTPIAIAAGMGAQDALDELVEQGCPDRLQLSQALHAAAGLRGGSAQMVHHLIGLRADVDFQWSVPRDLSRVGRLIFKVKSLQHQFGRPSLFTAFAHHMHSSTALMQAFRTSQHEAAAALIAAGANLNVRNSRNWIAADFAHGGSIPSYVQKGLAGDLSECRRVAYLALADDRCLVSVSL